MASGKIPQNFIDDLLDRVDIVDVVGNRVKLKRSGKNHMGLCPFHNEKSPSFSVNHEKQFYHCFGCGAGGDALQFVMEYDHLDFVQSVEELARMAGMEVPREESPQDRERSKQQKELYDLLQKASDLFYQNLKDSPERDRAVHYLKGRGLSGQIAKQFQIGFAPSGWSNLLDKLGTDDHNKRALLLAGMTVENDKGRQYDRFRNRVMFPIRDSRGRVVAFGGRVLSPDDKPKYLNSPETPVFHKSKELYGLYEAKKLHSKLERLMIVEGYMDVVALAQFGINYAVATLGTATSGTHLERMFKLVSDLVFCFDGDQAGRSAAWRALEVSLPFMEDGRQIRFLFLPDGEDPDTLVRKEGKDEFEQRIRHATPLTDYLFTQLAEGRNLDSLDGKAAYASEVLHWLQKLPGKSLLRALMTKRLSDLTGLSEQALSDITPSAPAEPEAAAAEPDPNQSTTVDVPEPPLPELAQPLSQPNTRIDLPLRPRSRNTLSSAEKVIANLLQSPQLKSKLGDLALLEKIQTPEVQLLTRVIELLEQSPHILSNPFITCDWLHQQGLEAALKPIENSDYFWLLRYKEQQHQERWLEHEIEQNWQKLQENLPNEEYLHLKNRMEHHSSEVTEEERRRFQELLIQRKQRSSQNLP